MEINKVLVGCSKEKLKEIPDNSIDSIVTDPPYELGFMGKAWDNTGIAYDVELWKECLRVLKHGGHLLAFSGTRTYHRMAVAIEDAGFEVRDMIEWVYGCLSDDTEILTKNGWEQYNISKLNSIFVEKEILIYDTENDIYKWEKPQRWNEYSVNKDTAYRIKSDTTDQIVSRNHRCLVEREGKLIFIKAEELDKVEFVPVLPSNFLNKGKRESEILQPTMLRKGKRLAKALFGKWEREEKPEQRYANGEKPCMERRFNLYETQREVCEPINKVCEMPEGVYTNGKKRWLCNGTQTKSSNRVKKAFNKIGVRSSYQSQCRGQQTGEPNVIQHKCRTQKIRTWTSYNTTMATIEPIEYTGIIFCPTVSTGAFVARRNGKIFLTGNSGFPKSLNIGVAVDKIQGNERKDLGEYDPRSNYDNSERKDRSIGGNQVAPSETSKIKLTKGNSDWEGWGTAMKPAHEPICVARKPIEKGLTVAQNCLKWGTGGINIDESRVEGELEEGRERHGGGAKSEKITQLDPNKINTMPAGRFPANLIHDGSEEVINCFPITNPSKKAHRGEGSDGSNGIYGVYGGESTIRGHDDNGGSAARFFKSILYYPKASKSERNKGCDELPLGDAPASARSKPAEGRENALGNPRHNHHPTVKPVALISYLIKLVTPKNGISLDPFGGSGTHAVACIENNFNYIIIEKELEHIPIIEARIKAAKPTEENNQPLPQLTLFD